MSYQDIENVLKETEEMFRIAAISPSSELALLLWKLGNASQLEEFHAQDVSYEWWKVYYGLQLSHYDKLAELGYVPLDWEDERKGTK
jgi:hypothetical protein